MAVVMVAVVVVVVVVVVGRSRGADETMQNGKKMRRQKVQMKRQ